MSLDQSISWVKNTLVPRMVASINEWKNASVSECRVSTMGMNKDGFASMLFSVDLCLNRDGQTEFHALVVKTMVNDPNARAELQSEKQFANEILAYAKLFPLFERIPGSRVIIESLSPKYYYSYMAPKLGAGECPEEDGIVIVENLKPKGFVLGDRISLDFAHTVLALQQIGRFHALSYAFKKQNNDVLQREVVSKIYESFHIKELCTDSGKFHSRVTDVLEKLSPGDSFGDKLTDKISDPKVFEWLITPKEPLAVVCHGDFCRNNMLFKYDENNKPSEVKLIDFQTIRYASPALDLSFFLCMNTTAELRALHWNDLLKAYSNEVRKTLAELLGVKVESLDPCYSFEAFKEEYRKHALYGYIITLTFLPCMICDEDEREEFIRVWKETGSWNSPESMAVNKRLGGEKVTKALVALALQVKDEGFINW